jgi:hypothetical protein
MDRQQQRILGLINGTAIGAKRYNRELGAGSPPARVRVNDTQHGVVIFADHHRATILLDNGHKMECGWPKVELIVEE